MTLFPDYDQYDGFGLAKPVKDGDISSIELCEEAIRRAENLNPKLNAIITKMYDYAREEAKHPKRDAPFGGVPFLLKDVHHALKGFTMSSGSALLRNYIPEYDAEIVNRFKKAGLIIFGRGSRAASEKDTSGSLDMYIAISEGWSGEAVAPGCECRPRSHPTRDAADDYELDVRRAFQPIRKGLDSDSSPWRQPRTKR
jgi:hypothetical protein